MMQQIAGKTCEAIRFGRSVCPRGGLLLPGRKDRSVIVMNCTEASLPDKDQLHPSRGKESAVWIAPSHALCELPSTIDADTLFHTGVLRLLVSVGPQQRRLTVSPAVTDFDAEWALEGAGTPWHKCVPVIVYVLEDVHQYRYVYDTFRRAHSCPTRWETLSTFMGMSEAPIDSDTL